MRATILALPAALLLAGCAVIAPSSPSTASGGSGTPSVQSPQSATPAATPAPGASATPSTGGVRFAPTASGRLDGKTIVVDPGHNAHWITSINNKRTPVFGTVGARCQAVGTTALDKKTAEHTIVWEISQKLVPMLLSQGATVIVTRPGDDGLGPCNNERADIANRNHADLLLSIHADGVDNVRLRGFSIIYAKQSAGGKAMLEASKAAAEKLLAAMVAHAQVPPANYGGTPGHPVNQQDLGVLNNVESAPALMLETGNVIQADDWAVLGSDAGKQSIAEGLAAAALDILG